MTIRTMVVSVFAAAGMAFSAQASTLKLVTSADGTLSGLVSPSNGGTYGVQMRGGRPGGADWELGVGEHTAQNGSFNQAGLTWPDPAVTLLDYSLSWNIDTLSVTLDGQTRSWDIAGGDWQFGNAIRIGIGSTDGTTTFTIDELDGETFAFSQTLNNQFQNFWITGHSLTNGFTMSGQVGMTNAGRSRRNVQITTAEFVPPAPIPLPAALPMALAAFAGLGWIGRKRRPA